MSLIKGAGRKKFLLDTHTNKHWGCTPVWHMITQSPWWSQQDDIWLENHISFTCVFVWLKNYWLKMQIWIFRIFNATCCDILDPPVSSSFYYFLRYRYIPKTLNLWPSYVDSCGKRNKVPKLNILYMKGGNSQSLLCVLHVPFVLISLFWCLEWQSTLHITQGLKMKGKPLCSHTFNW